MRKKEEWETKDRFRENEKRAGQKKSKILSKNSTDIHDGAQVERVGALARDLDDALAHGEDVAVAVQADGHDNAVEEDGAAWSGTSFLWGFVGPRGRGGGCAARTRTRA